MRSLEASADTRNYTVIAISADYHESLALHIDVEARKDSN